MRPTVPRQSEAKTAVPDSTARKQASPNLAMDCWFDDSGILDIDYFVKTLSGIKAKGVRPDLIGSIIAHYASKWLPGLSCDDKLMYQNDHPHDAAPENVTATWMKKRFFVETLVGLLPPEKDSVSCNFLLRLLRTANLVGTEPAYRAELEKRISWQLDQASLKELMIPAFSHTVGTLLDVELVLRLVKRFTGLDGAVKGGAALVKVAKLVDCYLAEAALDANLTLTNFLALGGALPSHARATDDGLYRAIDTYLKAHPDTTKQERKVLCRLIDSRKLSPEASHHAAQNERLPVRAVIQVLFSENTKVDRLLEWSGSLSGARSPNMSLEPAVRCLSKREVSAQQMEIRKLREEVMRLQGLCNAMQVQMEKLTEKKKGFFRWRKLSTPSLRPSSASEKHMDDVTEVCGVGIGRRTPVEMKTRLVQHHKTTPKWRKSLS
ncbi:coleoptile phototropism protein 1-like [Aristolochia californica]|uniref:coleoptile phototropism protein 1-like n=1 Tax=Aristolochia californica TaxID=171875 RepID=UPI0035E329FE